MSKTPNYDTAVAKILAELKPGERVCALTDEKWLMDEEEIAMYKKFNVPPSKYSPLSRMKLINAYFQIFDFWYNKHAVTGKPVISTVHPATGIRVLPDDEWYAKDFSEIFVELNQQQSFFDQLYKLSRAVPRAAGYNSVRPERSLAFISFGDEDSYFVLACRSKRTFASISAYDVEDSAEINAANVVQNSYNIVHSDRIFNGKFIRESYDCLNSAFLFDCRNCECCFGATNQRNKKYLFFNVQLSKEEWENKVAAIDLTSFTVRLEYEKKFRDLVATAVWPESFNVKIQNCSGEYLTDCNNVRESYLVSGGSNSVYANYCFGRTEDLYFVSGAVNGSECYYGLGFHSTTKSKFALSVDQDCLNCEYCESCYNCTDCFGCVGLRHKQFCILNKQYSEEEYWRILDGLKCIMLERGEYGDLTPAFFTTVHWDGSGAALVYGLNKEEAGPFSPALFAASDENAEGPPLEPGRLQKLTTLPDRFNDDVLTTLSGIPFLDEQMGRRFSYLSAELALYKKLGIAPSRRHPTGRIHDLYKEMNKPIFFDSACYNCKKTIRTAKNIAYPDRKIYCQACYLKYLEENN
ncbi:MAG: hypothetical protein V1664_04200 [Candidatus Uhrbacteria bacterium]